MPRESDATRPLLDLVNQLYAAPGTLDGWRDFLASLTTVFRGTTASLISHRLDDQEGSITLDGGLDPEARDLYGEYWGARDPWACSPRRSLIKAGRVVSGEDLVSTHDLRRTDYYNDFARRFDIVSTLAGVLELGPRALSVLSISGGQRRGSFGVRDHRLLEHLTPHIQRAIQMHRRLVAADVARDGLAAALHGLSRPTLLIGQTARVLFMNTAAEKLLATKDGLILDEGELRASAHDDTVKLRIACRAAVETFRTEGAAPGGSVTVGRPSGKRPLAVLVCPFPVTGHSAVPTDVDRAVAVVFVSDLDQFHGPDERRLQALFDLTPREAELATLMVNGVTLSEAAERMRLKSETVRSRLKDIFAKTGTHRQADLVRLVISALSRE